MGGLAHELRLAVRTLSKSRGFAAAAMLTLALGIGAPVAIFSVAYGVLARPLPYRDPSSLVLVGAQRVFAGEKRPSNFSAGEITDFRTRSRSLSALAGHSQSTLAFDGPDGVEPLEGTFVTEDFFATIGQAPAAGRLLGPADDQSSVAVVSARLAVRLAPDPGAAVGRTLSLGGHPYTVVGVAAPDFRMPSPRVDVWTPMGLAHTGDLAPWLRWPRGGGVNFVGRLRPGTSVAQARSDLEEVNRRLVQGENSSDRSRVVVVTPILDSVSGAFRPALRMLLGAVSLVWLVASANVANLILARHASRERELAVRQALGASRRRLLGHALAESAILGGGGGLGGVLLAAGMVRVLVSWGPKQLPRLDAIRIDGPVLAFALLVAVGATLAASLWPALRNVRQDAARALGATPRMAGSRRAGRLRSALVVAELAASVVLLVGALVLARSFVKLLHTDVGASTGQVLMARLDLSMGRQLTEPQERALGEALVERVRALPGVELAGLGAALPPNGRLAEVTLKGVPTVRGLVSEYAINAAPATREFFGALRIPLLRGRLFDDGDGASGPRVVILSADAAQDLFGDEPLGRGLTLPTRAGGSETATVVGVVGNVRYEGLARPAAPTIYVPFAQQPWSTAFLIARTTGDPSALVAGLRRAIGEVDRRSGVMSVRTLDDLRSEEAALPAFRSAVLGGVAALAVALAAIGLCGVVSYSVSRRTAEIGVRMALGAESRDVLRMVVREGLVLGASGSVLGVGAAIALTRLLRGFVYEVSPADPASFVATIAFVLALVLFAAYVPARRAALVDPTVALRAE